MAFADDKQHAHDLIEQLPPDQVSAVVRLLRSLLGTAPPDDEPVTEEERAALARSEAWFRARGGEGISMEEVLADFGLTMDDFPEGTPAREDKD